MDRDALMTCYAGVFARSQARATAPTNVTRLDITNNGHASIDVAIEVLEKLDAGELDEVLEGLEKVLACEP